MPIIPILIASVLVPDILAAIPAAWHFDKPPARITWGLDRRTLRSLHSLALLVRLMSWLALLGTLLHPQVAVRIGWALGLNSLMGFAIGLLASLPFMRLQQWINRYTLTVLGQEAPKSWSPWLSDPPRKWDEWLELVAITVILAPLKEEILTRGFLVHYLGLLLGDPFLSIGLGLLVFLLLHVWGGMQRVFSDVAFFAVVVGFLYSPLGLAGSIGFHMGCNLYFVTKLPRLIAGANARTEEGCCLEGEVRSQRDAELAGEFDATRVV